jgi:hypothetical protein
MVWIWQHDRRTDDYKIILNCVRILMKNKSEKEAVKGPTKLFFLKKVHFNTDLFTHGAKYIYTK